MNDDRRNNKRVATNLPAKWEGLSGGHTARVEDLSMSGCFINSSGRVDPGEKMILEVRLPSGEWLRLRGQVASSQPGVGFGVVFTRLTQEELAALRTLVG